MHQGLDQIMINKMLTRPDIASEELVPLLLIAQNNNQDIIIQNMVGYVQHKPEMVNKLMMLTRTMYDNNGDNLAIAVAKKLGDTVLANKLIAETEKYITEQTNGIFKKNLQQQLNAIKSSLDNALAAEYETSKTALRDDNWITSFDEVNQTAIDAQYKIVRHMMANQDRVSVAHVGDKNAAIIGIYDQLADNEKVRLVDLQQSPNGSVDVLLAPYTLHSQMEEIFKASQDLLRKGDASIIKTHPLFTYFNTLSGNGVFVATLCSGPNIQDFTNLVLGKHNLHLSPNDPFGDPSLKIFNNVETFFRCLDIFNTHYEKMTGKTIACDTSFAFSRIPLDLFCRKYGEVYPQLQTMSAADQEKFVRLLAVFTIGNDVFDLSITLKMSIQEKNPKTALRSFKPIDVKIETNTQDVSNEISLGQQNLDKQIQNLNGSELSMPYIKDADGFAQLAALQPVLGREKLNFVELGGGRGETNAIPKAVKDAGSTIHLLNIEPHEAFTKPYIESHHTVGIADVQVMQKTAQSVTVSDVINHYSGEKIDVLFASHAFYFLLGDLYKASQNPFMPLNQHPLWKYFKMLRDDGVFVITLQSGAGARLFRNALLGNHGLNAPANSVADETTSLLSSFGNMATLLRSFEEFAQRYQQEIGKKIIIKMHYAVANVPLGGFIVGKNAQTQGFEIHNPNGDDTQTDWLAPKMMDFYGNWKEQQLLATVTPEKAEVMSADELKKLGIEKPTEEAIEAKRGVAIKSQSTFLHILPIFAPAEVNMQHPNITLEITVQCKN